MKTIYERIKEVRTSQGKMTQAEFAEKMGMSRDRYKNYEYGKVEVDGMFINLICKTFHVNQRWLETSEGEMHEESEGITKEELRRIMTGNFTEAQIDIVMSFLSLPTEVLEMWLEHVKNGQ